MFWPVFFLDKTKFLPKTLYISSISKANYSTHCSYSPIYCYISRWFFSPLHPMLDSGLSLANHDGPGSAWFFALVLSIQLSSGPVSTIFPPLLAGPYPMRSSSLKQTFVWNSKVSGLNPESVGNSTFIFCDCYNLAYLGIIDHSKRMQHLTSCFLPDLASGFNWPSLRSHQVPLRQFLK